MGLSRGDSRTGASDPPHLDPGYRTALALSAALNIVMFFAEGTIGLWIGSAALTADAVDFLEDAGIYTLVIVAIGWAARLRAVAGLVMAGAMTAVGFTAVWQVVMRLILGGAPPSILMAGTAATALAVNVFCASRLATYKCGDASTRSIWLSTRNDAILNALTIVAAGGVALTSTGWPDIVAGIVIAAINLWAAAEIALQARQELRAHPR